MDLQKKLDNVFVVFENMDTMVHEQVVKNNDGSYTIVINCRLSFEMQREAYLHAISHIIGEDFNESNCDQIEKHAHILEISKEICPVMHHSLNKHWKRFAFE